jgi:dTDP-4-amino-4,6-dideoxygalactose transaminase
MNDNDIIPRRYFYPSLNTVPYVQNTPMPISEDTARRILCLPLYVGLNKSEIEKIAGIVY